MGVDFGEATQYSVALSRDVIDGMNKKIAKGYRPTYTPNGWLNDPYGEQGNRKIYTDPKRFYVLRAELRKVLENHGHYKVSDSLRYLQSIGFTSKRGTSISKTVLYNLYANPFICGEYQWNGQWYIGAWQPMITPTEFETLQILIGKGRSKSRKYNPLFSGFIKCGDCGSSVTTEPPKIKKQKNGNVHVYNYLRCTKNKGKCSQKCIRAEKAEEQMAQVLDKIEISPDFMEYCLERIHRDVKAENSDFNRQKSVIQKRYNENESNISSITEKYAQDKIPEDVYQSMMKRYKDCRFALNRELERYGTGRDDQLERLKEKVEFARSARAKFQKGGIADKKDVLAKLQSNLWLKDGEIVVDLVAPLSIFAKFKIPKSFVEPLEAASAEEKVQLVDIWSTWWEFIRTSLFLRNRVMELIVKGGK